MSTQSFENTSDIGKVVAKKTIIHIQLSAWQTSFQAIQKVTMLGFLFCFSLESKMDIVISHFNFNQKANDKCKLALKFIPLATTSKLFSLNVVQKCQNSQLCVSTGKLE